MKKVMSAEEVLNEGIEQEKIKPKVKKVKKKVEKKVKKKIVKGKKNQSNATKGEKSEKIKPVKPKESSKDKDNHGGGIEKPEWFMNLFEYLEYFDFNGISVYKTDESKLNGRQKSSNEIERKLFCIFAASPNQIYIEKPQDLDFIPYWKNLMQQDFAKMTGITPTTLSNWKKEKWYHSNRVDLMKYMFSKKTPNVLRNLYEGATEKDDKGKTQTSAIKLYLEYIESFQPGTKTEISGSLTLADSLLGLSKKKQREEEPE